jgi:hypothetical protein
LFNTGDEADYFFFVVLGKVDLFLPNPAVASMKRQIAE